MIFDCNHFLSVQAEEAGLPLDGGGTERETAETLPVLTTPPPPPGRRKLVRGGNPQVRQ